MAQKTTINRYVNHNLIQRFWPLGVGFLVIYIPVSFFILNDRLAGWFELADLLIFIVTLLFYTKTKNIEVTSNVLVFIGIPILLPWLITGGPAHTGLWWSLIYVVWAFFLTNKKWAFFWLTFYLGICAAVVGFSQAGFFKIAYTVFELLNLLFAFTFISALVYLFNEAVEYYFNLSNNELEERKKAEEKFKVLLESTPDALVIVDADENIVLVNRQTENIFGYKREEMIGMNIDTLIPGGFKSGHAHNKDLSARKNDGTEFPVEISLSPLKTEEHELMAIRDITQHNEQEEKLRKYSILEAKSKEMEQFTYIASHDLRHPLLTILNYIKIFDKDYADKLDEDGQMCLQLISEAATRMDKLVLGLLDYSRLSKIKQLETVNCNEAMQAVLADLNSTILSTHAKITVGNLPILNAYPLELRQLFQNLVTNALKFKKSGSPPELNISATQDERGYTFEFSDNGIGIEEKDSEKIFQIFQRLHAPEEYEGIGLGLAYCKKIAELHSGRIWLKSTPGEGSSFYFTVKT